MELFFKGGGGEMSAWHTKSVGWRKEMRERLLGIHPFCVHCGRCLLIYDPMDRSTWATLEHLTPLSMGGDRRHFQFSVIVFWP